MKRRRKQRNPVKSGEPHTFGGDLDESNLQNFLLIENASDQMRFVMELDEFERKAFFKKLAAHVSTDPIYDWNSEPEIIGKLRGVDAELFKVLSKYPEMLFTVSPRRFEEIVAGVLVDFGGEVYLTSETRDGGRDILAAFHAPFGRLLTVVECKRWSLDRKIGPDIIERFLWTLTEKDRASYGIIATTTHFSSGAMAIANEYRFRLNLRDFEGLQEWIRNYGKWSADDQSGIWLRNPIE